MVICINKIKEHLPVFWEKIRAEITILNCFAVVLLISIIYGFFCLSALQIVIWPAVVIIIIVGFRDQFSGVISRIKSVKGPWFECSCLQETVQKTDDGQMEILNKHADIIKDQQEDIKKKTFTNEQLVQQIALQNIAIDFERIYNLIFKSQIDLLLYLKNNRPSFATSLHLEQFFKVLQNAFPLMYASWTWQQYIAFLLSRNLITKNRSDNYTVSDYGVAFLEYIQVMNYQKCSIF